MNNVSRQEPLLTHRLECVPLATGPWWWPRYGRLRWSVLISVVAVAALGWLGTIVAVALGAALLAERASLHRRAESLLERARAEVAPTAVASPYRSAPRMAHGQPPQELLAELESLYLMAWRRWENVWEWQTSSLGRRLSSMAGLEDPSQQLREWDVTKGPSPLRAALANASARLELMVVPSKGHTERRRRPGPKRLTMDDVDSDPDYRFTLANERTFLAWIRTSLALVGGGLAVDRFLPEMSGGSLLALLLTGLGLLVAATAYRRWVLSERALRMSRPLPTSWFPLVLSVGVTLWALFIAGFVVWGIR